MTRSHILFYHSAEHVLSMNPNLRQILKSKSIDSNAMKAELAINKAKRVIDEMFLQVGCMMSIRITR